MLYNWVFLVHCSITVLRQSYIILIVEEIIMGKRSREAQKAPPAMNDTWPRAIILTLEDGPRTAKEISEEIRIAEKEVYPHLEHVRKTLHTSGRNLVITPAYCKKCGFVFTKRNRLTKPGKCPVCRHQSIEPPVFSLIAR